MATKTSTAIEQVLPSIPPSVATTPAPSIHGSIAASEIPLVPIGRSREGSTERHDGSDEERGNTTTSQSVSRVQSRRNSEVLASDLAPVDGGRQAWTFLAGCFVLEAVIFGYAYSSGAYQDYHLHDPRSPMYGQPAAAISAIGTLVIGTQCFVPILIRGFVRTFPHLIRRVTLICIGIGVCSLIICSFLTHVVPMLIFQSIYGFSTGIVFTPVILYLNEWWNARRGLATGIIFAGSGCGGIFFPITINAMLDKIGFPWTIRIMALMTLIFSTGATLCLKPRLPVPTVGRHSLRSFDRSLLKALLPGDLRPMLAPLAGLNEIAFFVQSCGWYTISLYISTYCTSLGFSSSTATGVLSAFNAAATLGYLILGPLNDKFVYTKVMCASMLICSLSAFLLLGFSRSLPMVILFVLTFGVGGGGFTTFFSSVARDIAAFSNQDSSTIFLGLVFLRGTASVIGPLVGASLYKDAGKETNDFSVYGTRGFRGVVIYVGTTMLIGSILAMAATWQRKKDISRASDAVRERWQSQ